MFSVSRGPLLPFRGPHPAPTAAPTKPPAPPKTSPINPAAPPKTSPINPPARYKGRVIDEITLNAMTPSFADIGREKVEKGRYISDADYQHNARVCLIGQDLVDKLFPDVDPLDKEVSVAG